MMAQQTSLRPGRDCARFVGVLPLLESDDLEPSEGAAARAHLAECAWCAGRLASYATVDAALRRHFADDASPLPIADIADLLPRVASADDHGMVHLPRLLAPGEPRVAFSRPALSGAVALAAVLLLALLAQVLFASRGQNDPQPGPAATLAPVLATKTVYLATSNGIYAVGARGGSLRWRYPAVESKSASPTGVSSAALAGDTLYVSLAPQGAYSPPATMTIAALRTTDGTVAWRTPVISATTASLAVDNGTVYITAHVQGSISASGPRANGDYPSEDYLVYALRASDGKQLWRYQTGEPVISAPAAVGGIVYFGTTANLYALRGSDGSLVWRSTIGIGAQLEGAPPSILGGVACVVQGSRLYVAAATVYWQGVTANHGAGEFVDQSLLWTIRLDTGEHLLRSGVQGGNFPVFPPAIASGLAYVSAGDALWALSTDPADSTRGWLARMDASLGSPATAGDTVYACGTDGGLYALRASDGKQRWHAQTTCSATSPPPDLSDGALFVAGGSAVYALNASDGSPAWRYLADGHIIGATLIVG